VLNISQLCGNGKSQLIRVEEWQRSLVFSVCDADRVMGSGNMRAIAQNAIRMRPATSSLNMKDR
jgi:hypothetical protein